MEVVKMEKTTISKSAIVEGNKAVITETTETRWDIYQIEEQLRQLQYQKQRLVEQNQFTLKEYNEVVEKEVELRSLKTELETTIPIEEEIEVIE